MSQSSSKQSSKKTSDSKTNKICYLDVDDFGEKNHRLDWMWQLRQEFPNFKINVFAIPVENEQEEWLTYLKSIDWLQLCVHGYKHKNNEEVSEKILKELPKKGFAKVYRAPFWQLSDTMYKRLKKLDYKIMLQPDDKRKGIKVNWNIKNSPPPLKVVYGHGHVQDYEFRKGQGSNGIVEAIPNILKLPKDTRFKFL